MGGNALTIIGLTGRYCAGKDHVATLFAERNIPVIDVDKLGHQVLGEVGDQLVSEFGNTIMREDGSVDRKRLGSLVFADPERLKALERIVHPHMVRRCMMLIEAHAQTDKRALVINAALLGRMKLDVLCDAVCFVHAPVLVRLLRSMHRDGSTIKSFLRMEKAQQDITVREIKGAQSVHILENWGRKPFIHRQVHEFCATMGI